MQNASRVTYSKHSTNTPSTVTELTMRK